MPKSRFKDGCIVTRVVPSGKWKFLASSRLLVSRMFFGKPHVVSQCHRRPLKYKLWLKTRSLYSHKYLCKQASSDTRHLTPDACLSRCPFEQRPKMIGG